MMQDDFVQTNQEFLKAMEGVTELKQMNGQSKDPFPRAPFKEVMVMMSSTSVPGTQDGKA